MDDADLSQPGRTNSPVKEKETTSADSNVSYEDLMSRIRHIVLVNRLRVGTKLLDFFMQCFFFNFDYASLGICQAIKTEVCILLLLQHTFL